MKRMISIIVLSAGLMAGPAMANHDGPGLLTKENVGGALGATIGGFLGSKVGDGDGQLAATAAGAVGGYIVGRDVGHNYGGSQRQYSGRGHYSSGRKHYSSGRRDYRNNDRRYKPRVSRINKTFRARTTSNVRSGPGTRYQVIDQLYNRERVQVIGKVRGRNWFMVRTGHRRGFVYAPLLRPDRGYGHRDHNRRYDRDHNRARRSGYYH